MDESQEIHIDVDQISQELKIRPQIYLKILASFGVSLIEKTKCLSDALAVDDKEQMRMILHEIKGTASNLRLATIVGPEEVLHAAVKSGVEKRILAEYFEVLKTESEKLHKYITALVNPEGDSPQG